MSKKLYFLLSVFFILSLSSISFGTSLSNWINNSTIHYTTTHPPIKTALTVSKNLSYSYTQATNYYDNSSIYKSTTSNASFYVALNSLFPFIKNMISDNVSYCNQAPFPNTNLTEAFFYNLCSFEKQPFNLSFSKNTTNATLKVKETAQSFISPDNFTYSYTSINYVSGYSYQPYKVSYNNIANPPTITAINVSFQATTSSVTLYNLVSPSHITLNYGYTVPIFLTYNINLTQTPTDTYPSSCNYFDSLSFSSITSYLQGTNKTYGAGDCIPFEFTSEVEAVAESFYQVNIYNSTSSANIYPNYYGVSSGGSITTQNKGISYYLSDSQSVGGTPTSINNTILYSQITGFGSSNPILEEEGSSAVSISSFKGELIIDSASYPAPSTVNGYALYETVSS